MSDLLSIENLHIRFDTDDGPVDAVRGVDLTVAPGEIVALVGESGSGKTVTARAILGLLPETATATGQIRLDDRDVLTARAAWLRELRGGHAAMVFQEPSTALNPVYPVGWQIGEGLRAHGVTSRAERRSRAIAALADVGIPDPHVRVDHFPHQFSGGQKQRIMIAAAIALNPGLIVADEPTSALDVTVQAEILDLLRKVRADFGTAILLITHNMGVVADIADRVAVMRHGRIVEHAPAAELFAAPRDAYTRELLAAIPELGRNQAPDRAPGRSGNVVVADRLTIDFPGRFGRRPFRAVHDVSLRIAEGEVLGLVGESGSGKTTIGRAIAGLTPVAGGDLTVLGERIDGRRRGRSRRLSAQVGFVFQDPATSFNPLLTIGDSIAEPLLVHRSGLTPRAVAADVARLLGLVALPPAYARRYPHELSGGQRQRASLARAIALKPRLLIADEPTSALDVSVQATILELLLRLHEDLGFAALFISHDLAVIEAVATRVVVLHHGEVVESGSTTRVLRTPEHAYTRRLVSAVPVPDPARQAERRATRG